MYICAGDIEQFDFAKPIGIGLVNAASRVTELILSEKPKSITFVGTAGSYGNCRIFDIVESSEAVNIESSYYTDASYSPLKNNLSISNGIVVNSTNYITTSVEVAGYYLRDGIGIENMEFYSIVEVANYFRVPVKGIFIVTNYCNKEAHNDFCKNHKVAMKRLTTYIKSTN